MDIFGTLIGIIILFGISFAFYIFFKDLKKNLKDTINMMKEGGGRGSIGCSAFFFPIWFPIWIIDKIYKLKIFENDTQFLSEDDLRYKCEKKTNFMFIDYNKYILVNTDDKELLISLLKDFIACNEVDKVSFESSKYNDITSLIKINEIDFFNYLLLIQWLETIDNIKNIKIEGLGILMNSFEKEKSFIVQNDKTKNHINSLIGKDYKQNTFFIYIFDDFANNQFLSYNNSIKVDIDFDFEKQFNIFDKLIFDKLI